MSVDSIPFKKSFIESQFPVSKVSKESYKERKAGGGQTLTSLGKWWGRKPLILIRAALFGLLLPATDNPARDREIFLKLLTMDDEGMWQRKKSSIPANELQKYLSSREKAKYFDNGKLRSGFSREEKEELQRFVFMRMGYDVRLKYCFRPEEIDGPSPKSWKKINEHLGTNSSTIPELIEELGIRQFGAPPSVGDCFCGGGSVPFEAARIGCNVFGSDLNPISVLLTWSSLNIIGGGDEITSKVIKSQKEIYDAVDSQLKEWGIEYNEKGWRADAYLYCNEVVCPECGWKIPLLSSRLIGGKTHTIIELEPNTQHKNFHIKVREGVTLKEVTEAKSSGTVKNSKVVCPNIDCIGHQSPIKMSRIRRDHEGGLRLWNKEDIIPLPDDIFQERLYCIRWIEEYETHGIIHAKKHYMIPDEYDLEREKQVVALLKERLVKWQQKGYLPSRIIQEGDKTNEPIRTRGWTYWHHLFNPRQLLILGCFNQLIQTKFVSEPKEVVVYNLLEIGKLADIKGIGCRSLVWNPHKSKEGHGTVFSNQSFKTMYDYCTRTLDVVGPSKKKNIHIFGDQTIIPNEANSVNINCDFWITDPPYADAIIYHELSEFFLAWYEKPLKELFPEWYTDSKRALAIKGSDEEFRKSMVDVYRNLTNHMPEMGAQIVMFTHQDANVWADLAMILWAAGLQVTAAWCISTETDTALKAGNYVQGTVLLVLRKQTSDDVAFLDEIFPEVEEEVKKQLNSMLEIDDKEDPNFGDTDYQLAAYAAALRVLTRYKQIEDIDIERELSRSRGKNEKNPLEGVIENAVKIACDYLVPAGIDSWVWKQLMPEERFYLKGLELESHGEYRTGAYQELARGFGIREYKNLQQSKKANMTRLKTASEFKDRDVGGEGFSASLVRNILFAIRQTKQEDDTAAGKAWIREYPGYWEKRKEIVELLRYFASLGMNYSMEQWQEDSKAAKLLSVVVEQDHV
ncbi:Adenine-specific DNA methylase, contains a Zn-ribbon domain [Methanococcoides vulcani]|uniref:Adenine-specific DNA methylase, contains a Zn-ribbon domain n=1 Tax=Methanococcoides vulcani TaxID=1353158 RepID=A0A1I0B748_9EURY|nr:anti-phage-associated DUF1156 domain-containing protein [Methanococcoides vulcani]SET02341.1 Adenine-specific DNA methylase, contains a Zn-ribbon domain [Methanococcoides vulcani]